MTCSPGSCQQSGPEQACHPQPQAPSVALQKLPPWDLTLGPLACSYKPKTSCGTVGVWIFALNKLQNPHPPSSLPSAPE